MTMFKFLASCFIYILTLLFCLNWQPHGSLFVFGGSALLVFVSAWILLAIFEKRSFKIQSWLAARSPRQWLILCGSLTFLGSVYYAFGPLEAIPHAWDDAAYLWMARCFAAGRLFVESHDLPEFFHTLFFVNDGSWYPIFQPGWPLLLALGVLVHLEFLINPILITLAVLLCYPIGRRVFDERVALLAVILMTASQAVHTFGGMLFAHPLSLVLTQLAVLMVLRLSEKQRLTDVLVLSVCLGWLFLTRALNAVALLPVVGIPLLVFVLQRKIAVWRLLAGIPIALGFLLLQGGYNQALSGSPTIWPQQKYFQMTEEHADCHDLGFGEHIGCPNVHPLDNFPDGFFPKDAVGVIHQRMDPFLQTLLGWSILFLFVGLPFFRSDGGWRKYMLLSVFLSLIGAYFFFYFHGVRGRYYFEASFAVFILFSAGLIQTYQVLKPFSIKAGAFHVPYGPLLRALIPAVLVTYFIFNAAYYVIGGGLLRNFFFVDRRFEQLTQAYPPQSLFFFPAEYNAAFPYLEPGLQQPHLFLRDLGKQNAQMLQYYPGWRAFRFDPKSRRMTELKREIDPALLFIEMESKYMTADTSGDYLHPLKMERSNREHFQDLSGRSALAFEASKPRAFATFRQYFFREGSYAYKIRFLTGPDRGVVRLSIDGQSCSESVDLYAPRTGRLIWEPESCRIRLGKGSHRIKWEVIGRNEQSEGYHVVADWMEFRLQETGRRPE